MSRHTRLVSVLFWHPPQAKHDHPGRRALPLSVALLAVLAVATVGRADLVAHYPLDEPAGTSGADSVVDVVGGYNGTPTDAGGGPVFGVEGATAATETAASFSDMDTKIDVPFSLDLNPESFTVAAWAYPEEAGNGHQSVFTSRDDAFPDVYGYVLYSTPGSTWEFWTGPGVGAGGWDVLTGPPVDPEVWTHLAVSYDADSNEKVLWVDGEPFTDDGLGNGYMPNERKDLHIGAGADLGNQFFFNGTIDDVAVWDAPLDQATIADIMANGAASYTTSQIAHWKLDEAAGAIGPGTVIDSAGGQHVGGAYPASMAFGAEGANANTGTSAVFNDASIDVPYEEALNPEEQFTITAWARPATAGAGYQSVFTSRDDAVPDLAGYILYSTPDGIWQFWTGPGPGAGGWDGVDGPAVEPGEWVHLAISYDLDTNEKVLWVNGEPYTDDGAGAGYFPNEVKDLHIGAGGDLGTQYRFVGNIDDVGIFDEILSQEQIMNIMANGVQGPQGILGDYNDNGQLDSGDLDMQAIEIDNGENNPAYDLNNDSKVDFTDRKVWVEELKNTWIGDANLDGEFNSSDMVQVFVAGKYETEAIAGWDVGDWDGDLNFTSSDMVAAFVGGGYEQGERIRAANAVPEPVSATLLLLGALGLLGIARRR